MKPFRRFEPKPPYAYCRDCSWTDPDTAHGKPLEPLGVSVEQAARAHVAVFGHEVRLVRSQEVVLKPAELAEATR